MPTLRRATRAESARAHVDAGAHEVNEVATPEKLRDNINKAIEKVTPKRRGGDDAALVASSPSGGARPDREAASAARIPTLVQFPLVAAISFATASLGYSVVAELTQGELAGVSRSPGTREEIAILAGWRIFELALSWFGGLDGLDVAMMDFLSHGPAMYLLFAFYNLSAKTTIAALAVDVVSASVPFSLLRPLSAVHKPSSALPNRELIGWPLQLLTAGLSTSIYSVVLVSSLRFLLPSIFVVHFEGLRNLEPAYSASYLAVLPVTLLFGIAASTFIFPPFATTGKTKEDERVTNFDPAEASLGETVWWNFWGYTTKAKVAIGRTAVTLLVTGVNTYLACAMTIPGVEPEGAAAYAGVWVFAALCTGLGLGVVGRD
ncbi:hypothetical protein MKX07_001206 [Trichoderma sp. CBMAI-0711]|uniref:Uncharacterized protein n=1 Tax=Trichoderma parareesei TaxID=858221 RepID=A0A2H2ZVB0_TRIPA|nr:hypothetical protein MKX07_001206 [Trichoderma sp. CBMAI-0711]OTA03204.1 hypothetical protein A9Z42_0036450 [Trichoderma parareesei]